MTSTTHTHLSFNSIKSLKNLTILAVPHARRCPTLVLDALQRWKADLCAGVPAMYLALLADPGFDSYDLTSVRITMSGGDSVPPELGAEAERCFRSKFTTVYGQTELSPIVAQTSPDDQLADKCGTVGRLLT